MNIGEVHARLREDFPVARAEQAPLLRGRWASWSRTRTPAGYRKYSADDVERLRLRPAAAARPPPAAEGDPRAPRRPRPRARAAAAHRRPAGAAPGGRCRTASPAAEAFDADPSTAAADPPRAAGRRGDRRGAARASSRPSAWSSPRPGLRAVRQRRDRGGPHGRRARGLRHRAAPPAGLQDRGRPRGRPGRAGGRADPAQPRGRRGGTRRGGDTQIAALSVRLHATLVKAGLRGLPLTPRRAPGAPLTGREYAGQGA